MDTAWGGIQPSQMMFKQMHVNTATPTGKQITDGLPECIGSMVVKDNFTVLMCTGSSAAHNEC